MKDNEKGQNWYAVYTAPRAEKKVSERFTNSKIEHYLPLKKVKHQWTDRVKEILMPVINGYIFVKITVSEFQKVTSIYGSIAFVREGGNPVQIPENQITNMRKMVEMADELVEFTNENFGTGQIISIIKGPLEGMEGELVRLNGRHKVLIRIAGLGSAFTTIPISYIREI